jgi:hypothetical protein
VVAVIVAFTGWFAAIGGTIYAIGPYWKGVGIEFLVAESLIALAGSFLTSVGICLRKAAESMQES